MRADSPRKKIPNSLNFHTLNDGFTSDYYSCQNAEKRNKILQTRSRKYSTVTVKTKDPNEEVEILKHYKRIYCVPIGHQFDYKILVSKIKDYMKVDEIFIESMKNITIFTSEKKEKIIFIFDYGVVVFWSYDEIEEQEISQIFLQNCKYALSFPKDKNLVDLETNIFYFRRGENFNISNRNRLSIESNDICEILSVAYALGQHTILNHYENEVSNTIEETKKIPIEMRDKGEITFSKKEISRNIGLIFMRRSAVNLNSDILDTPDIFWEQKSEMEVYYSTIRRYLEIDKRVEILDRRMKILKELYDVMNNQILTQGKFRLEWIVVYLIVIEIFVSIFWKMLVKDILKLY
jgi:uncharacterized Rmd1/YagE family protein